MDFWFHHIIADASFTTTLNLAPTAAISLYLLGAVQVTLHHHANSDLTRETLPRDLGLSVIA
ncbi:MAG: hypothetical protein ACI9G5_001583, partial [Paracoccaceae bacterium]